MQKRNANYPLPIYDEPKSRALQTRTETTDFKSFLGSSFRLREFPYEDGVNIGSPVIDMPKYLADYPNAVKSLPAKKSDTDYSSYAGYDRYEIKINKSKTISSGFKLDFKVFSISSKKKSTEIFKGSIIQESKRVNGELSVKFYDRYYEFVLPVSIRDEVFEDYMDKSFLDVLYRLSTDELIEEYGAFVLIKFYSGAQAYALYEAESKTDTHNEESIIEKNLDREINATIDLKENNNKKSTLSASNDDYQRFVLGRTPGTGQFETNSFTKVQFSIRTVGGLPAYSKFTTPKNIDETNFDITNWCNSLANKEELTIAALPEKLLIPLADFIEEDNLKNALYQYYEFGPTPENKFKYMQEPCISIRMVFYNQQIAVYETSIKTRYGEYIPLKRASMFPTQASAYLVEEAERIKKIFPNLAIEGLPNYYKTLDDSQNSLYANVSDDINEFDMDNMTKFIDSNTGKIYLLTSVQATGKKIAYTLYNDKVVKSYIFQNLINSLPVNNSISLETIRKNHYKVAL